MSDLSRNNSDVESESYDAALSRVYNHLVNKGGKRKKTDSDSVLHVELAKCSVCDTVFEADQAYTASQDTPVVCETCAVNLNSSKSEATMNDKNQNDADGPTRAGDQVTTTKDVVSDIAHSVENVVEGGKPDQKVQDHKGVKTTADVVSEEVANIQNTAKGKNISVPPSASEELRNSSGADENVKE